MRPAPFASAPLSSRPRMVLQELRKCIPWLRGASAAEPAGGHLGRLALLSPHLLPDLGFVEDRTAGNPHRTVWRKGALVVSISRDPAAVAPRVDVRRAA